MRADQQPKPLSWRDPEGFVVRVDGRVFRSVRGEAVGKVKDLLACQWFQREMDGGHIVQSWWAGDGSSSLPGAQEFAWLEHRAQTFPCYPRGVTATQLHDAACMTLRVAAETAKHGWRLKDASAWSVLVEHGRPVFCGVLSFDDLESAGVWFTYAQFCRHFIIPLLIYKHTGMRPLWFFLNYRDDVTPQMAYPLIRVLGVIDSIFLDAVVMPVWLHGKRKSAKKIGGVGVSKRPREMVQYLSLHNPRTVRDIDCNAGEYSLPAASHGAIVVAGDLDQDALGEMCEKLRHKSANVDPAVRNIAQSTPAIGWMNREVASFLERACNQFDLIIEYGLIHHVVVTERLALHMIMDLFVKLNLAQILIEWMASCDSKLIEIAGTNLHPYANLDADAFGAAFAKAYVLADMQVLSKDTRTLYLWGWP